MGKGRTAKALPFVLICILMGVYTARFVDMAVQEQESAFEAEILHEVISDLGENMYP